VFKFDDEVHAYQKFVRNNLEDSENFIIISEQLFIKDLERSFIDILAIDLSDKRVVIVELKNETAKDDIVGQTIKYYDLLQRSQEELLDLIRIKKDKFSFDIEEINLNPKILLIVPEFDMQLIRIFSYVTNLEVKIVKYNAIQKQGYYELIKEVYCPDGDFMSDKSAEITKRISNKWGYDEYLKDGYDPEKINLAKNLISHIGVKCHFKDQKLDTYFYDKKITLTIDGKVWGNILLKKKMFDNSLELSVNLKKDQTVDIVSLRYNAEVMHYTYSNKNVKIKFFQLPINFLNAIL
jgi:hypothetical protein